MLTHVLDVANYAISAPALPMLLVASLILALGLVVLIGERGSWVSIAFWAMTVSAAIWLFSYGVGLSTPYPDVALWWFKAGHIGVVSIPTFVAIFTLAIVRRVQGRWPVLLSAAAGSLIFGAAAWTTPLFLRGVKLFAWGYYPQYGPLSLPFLLVFVGLLGSCLHVYWTEYQRAHSRIQKQRLRAFLYSFCVGYLGLVDYVACFGVPLYPFGYLPILGFIVLAARAIWRYRLTDLTPAFAADTIVDTMNDALIVSDDDGMIRFVNAAACSMFRFNQHDFIGQPLSVLARDEAGGRERLQAVFLGEGAQDQELVLWTRDGEPVEVSLSVARLRRKDGASALHGTVAIARDIRERKRAEKKEQQLAAAAQAASAAVKRRAEELAHAYDELKQTQAMLVQAEKMAAVGQLASGTAHEVRNPLSIIRLGVEHLERSLRPLTGPTAEILEMIKEAITRSDRIIRSMLDFSRPAQLELKPLSLEAMISAALELAEKQLNVHNVRVTREIAPDLPQVLADENQMKQVFINLILNAFQAMPEGGELAIRCHSRAVAPAEPRVGLGPRDVFQSGERVVVCEVRDTGPGIPREALSKVFDPFFTTKAPGQGTGLGLTITRTIIEQHGGVIVVESEEGRGTCMRILLPIVEAFERPPAGTRPAAVPLEHGAATAAHR